MAHQLTKDQTAAVEHRDRSLLVSAAAGSGKTATLTRRIIESLLDKENPADITTLLIVTFTNAAVADLKEKIGAALKAALAENPKNDRLKKQLLLLPNAHVMTIDAFCNEVLKENAEAVGFHGGYRIADKAETLLLSRRMMEGLINAVYSDEYSDVLPAEDFAEMCDCFFKVKKSKALAENLTVLYNKTVTHERGAETLLDLAEEYAETAADAPRPPEKTRFASYLMGETVKMANHYEALFTSNAVNLPVGESGGIAKLAEICAYNADFCRRLSRASAYEEMRNFLADFNPPKQSPGLKQSEKDHPDIAFLLASREKLAQSIKDFRTKYFSYSAEEYADLYRKLYKYTVHLGRFMVLFRDSYMEEKKRLGICEYADIERYAYQCLWQKEEKTAYAEELAARFSAVYIDEYQDVNRLQNKIFEAVSRPDNRFTVGDIKQSIYCWRSANPDIFARMKEEYPPLKTDEKQTCASIFMSANFRCDEPIINFVNTVFDRIFGLCGKSIGYRPEDRLIFAKTENCGHHEPEFWMATGLPTAQNSEETESASVLAKQAEARAVGEKIRELLDSGVKNDGTPIRPEDVAILFRSPKRHVDMMATTLKSMGIPVEISQDKDFFFNAEILLTLCVLNVIDNPERDVYLAGLLLSPLEDFSPDELLLFRKSGERTLFDDMVSFAEATPTEEKVHAFLKRLERWRRISETVGVDVLLERLIRETALLPICTENGGKDNLLRLTEYARRYESEGYKGLYNFIHTVNRLIENGEEFDSEAKPNEASGSVRILSFHASKGLEFPVCFVCGCGDRLSPNENSGIHYSEDFGLSFQMLDVEANCLLDNPVNYAVSLKEKTKSYEEQLRILYVALTRARERLFVTGATFLSSEKAAEKMKSLTAELSPYSVMNLGTFSEILSAAGIPAKILDFSDRIEEIASLARANSEQDGLTQAPDEADTSASEPVFAEQLAKDLTARFSFSYPNAVSTSVPQKLSVSKLKPDVLDSGEETEEESLSMDRESADKLILQTKVGILPSFVTGKEDKESALRGTATHAFLQFCNLERLEADGAEAELKRLVSDGFLTKRDADRVRLPEIRAFAASLLFRRMRTAVQLYRELRFHVRLPAAFFTQDPERKKEVADCKILVQGVIDCLLITPEGDAVLIDYKTDRIPASAKNDLDAAAAFLADRHTLQLSYYALAVKEMFGFSPKSAEIFSLALGKSISIRPISFEKL